MYLVSQYTRFTNAPASIRAIVWSSIAFACTITCALYIDPSEISFEKFQNLFSSWWLAALMYVWIYLNIWMKLSEKDRVHDAKQKSALWRIPMTLVHNGDPFGRGFSNYRCIREGCSGYLIETNLFTSNGLERMNPLSYFASYMAENTCNQKEEVSESDIRKAKQYLGKDRCFCNVCGIEYKDVRTVEENPLSLIKAVSML